MPDGTQLTSQAIKIISLPLWGQFRTPMKAVQPVHAWSSKRLSAAEGTGQPSRSVTSTNAWIINRHDGVPLGDHNPTPIRAGSQMTIPATEESDPFCLPSDRAAALLAGAPWQRFAVIGDSLSAGTGDPRPGYAAGGWADRVAGSLRRIHPGLAYANIAEVGATTARTLATQAPRLADFHPDLVHVPCGANDLFRPAPDYARTSEPCGGSSTPPRTPVRC
ncbi:GDSL-type esterase/lipase family protein [Streptomyces sp. NPDC059680]|uniref:GDSL-type esterase/lipase family protein n=1 Tax=Streptomyces sp. NPDC059680 TaxID=3346904 RepID=UPI0036BA4D4E